MKGKLIVLYGANNLGKSTQLDLLEAFLQKKHFSVTRIKYPIYDSPTGKIINAVLREGKEMPEDELQKLYVENRKEFEPRLLELLASGTIVIAEDYVGTGIAWGMVRGLSLAFLEKINSDLYPADSAFMLYGKRFATGREASHRNETDDAMWQKAQDIHLTLAKKYGWEKIDANHSIAVVQQAIRKVLVKSKIIA